LAKRKHVKTKKKLNILNYLVWVLGVVALILTSSVTGYYFGYKDAKEEITKIEQESQAKRLALLQKIEDANKKGKETVNKRLKEVLKKEAKRDKKEEVIKKVKSYAGSSHEYSSSRAGEAPKRVKRESKVLTSTKPKLAIIIDDVSVRSHIKAIKSLNLPLTMSFLPPSKARPNSAKLAAKESFYMVHLPMEAKNFNAEEPITLRVTDSQSKITSVIKEIKYHFPKVKYINNHTGSKFTSDEKAMNKLIVALNEQNISFIDSRTTADTKVPVVMEKFGYKYVSRDVFLDHHPDKAYVKSQIKKAIKIAKSEGIAIAIGHPHANTIMALYESKNLFKDVELVYVNRLY